MPGLDLSGFNVPEEKFEGLYQAAGSLQRRNVLNQRLALAERGRQDATGKFVQSYLDPKDYLTGTAYDPQIVSGLQSLLQQGEELTSKGASTSDVLMALGPQVQKINDYSTKAKLINNNIKNSIGRLKGYTGYDPEALEQEARKQAFYDANGKLKDISQVDPSNDYVTMATKNNPEAVTTGKGLDDFVAKTPMHDYSNSVTTAYGGRSKTTTYDAKAPFWMGLQKDAQGNVMTDDSGNPKGLGVTGGVITGDDNKPIINPETNQPYSGMDKDHFNAIMRHNPDVADYVRGEVNKHFRAAGAKQLPAEGSPQWEAMARHVLGDELQTRDKSYFKTRDQQKETAPAIKVELGSNPEALANMAKYEEAVKLKGDYYVPNPNGKQIKTNTVQTVGEIFNNNPSFLAGDHKDVNGRSVVDVTSFFPGGGIKTGRGADDNYESIYYDPNKRSLLLEVKGKEKDANGKYPTSYEEVPESKAGIFMSRIAGANGVDPDKVPQILSQLGYKGAKFNNVQSGGDLNAKLSQEHADKIDAALKNDKLEDLKGVETPDGKIDNIDTRTLTSWIPGRDRYEVKLTKPDGTQTSKTFKDKKALTDYIKTSNAPKKAILD